MAKIEGEYGSEVPCVFLEDGKSEKRYDKELNMGMT